MHLWSPPSIDSFIFRSFISRSFIPKLSGPSRRPLSVAVIFRLRVEYRSMTRQGHRQLSSCVRLEDEFMSLHRNNTGNAVIVIHRLTYSTLTLIEGFRDQLDVAQPTAVDQRNQHYAARNHSSFSGERDVSCEVEPE